VKREIGSAALLEGWVPDAADIRICGIRSDAGRIEAGEAWVDLDGGRDVRLAAARGAALVLTPKNARTPGRDIPAITVPGLENRLPELAARFWRHPAEQIALAALAGNGSSSAVGHFLAQSWRRCAAGARRPLRERADAMHHYLPTAGIGEPFTLQERLNGCLENGARQLALDVAPHALERGWLDDLALEVAVYCGDGKENDKPLRPLFTRCRPRFAVVDHDTAEGKALTRLVDADVEVLTFGTNGSTELQGFFMGMDAGGMTIRIASPWGGGQVHTGLLGRRSLSALLAAAGTLALMGMPWDRVMHQVEIMGAVPGRLHRIDGEPGQATAVIDHAHTADELEEALRALRSHLHGRLSCVLSRRAARDARTLRVARSFSDRVFAAGPLDRAQVIRDAFRSSGSNDIVLIAGSVGEIAGGDEECSLRRIMEAAA
jgi:UDP-N-acetylmuramoyl-L-alanyl-D-glutamate--2,6-diaminopimelate ligase